LIEKGLIAREEFYAEDFRGAGDVSGATESDTAMNEGGGRYDDNGFEHALTVAYAESAEEMPR
jgi:hypothetical protein